MENLEIRIHFIQPFRVIPWQDQACRAKDPLYLRGGSWARWHNHKKPKGTGRPYLTGTLVRSALCRSIEKLVAGFNRFDCCFREDKTDAGILAERQFSRNKRHYALREKIELCCEDDYCAFCLIKGWKNPKKTRGEDKLDSSNKAKLDHFIVHFSNFKAEKKSLDFEKKAVSRVVNRVDSVSGKSRDYMKIFELSPADTGAFRGRITVNCKDAVKKKQITTLIAAGFSDLKILASSVCRIDIISPDHNGLLQALMPDSGANAHPPADGDGQPYFEFYNEAEPDMTLVERTAQKLCGILSRHSKPALLRKAASHIHSLRQDPRETVLDLPRGNDGSDHYFWDLAGDQESVRSVLETFAVESPPSSWVASVNSLADLIYTKSKAESGAFSIAPSRLLGEAEFYSTVSGGAPGTSLPQPVRSGREIYQGRLVAKTPFFLGSETTDSLITNPILLNRDNTFRLPASAIRGAFRRDLRLLYKGACCHMALGSSQCQCPVCKIMSCLIFEDGKTRNAMPPDIRPRIRIDPRTGTAKEGALFELETGIEGIGFEFRLHLERTQYLETEDLEKILALWQNGQAFIGGHSGIGMGRFKLCDLSSKTWKTSPLLSKPQSLIEYLSARGYVGQTVAQARSFDSIVDAPSFSDCIELTFIIKSPLLSRDTAAAIKDERNTDVLMYRKRVLDPENPEQGISCYALTGSSLRGSMRDQVARAYLDDKNVAEEPDHEDCTCLLCELFGSEHQQGALKIGDLDVFDSKDNPVPMNAAIETRVDHVAIDRFTGGAIGQKKYDEYLLAASPESPLKLKGVIWIAKTASNDAREALTRCLAEFKKGMASLGGMSGVGYGWVADLTIDTKAEDLRKALEKNLYPAYKIEAGNRYNSQFSPPALNKNAVYYPHSFLPPLNTEVKREVQFVSHAGGPDKSSPLLSGKLFCSLTACGPVVIPDTRNDDFYDLKTKYPGHKSYSFFSMAGKGNNPGTAIPGASIRGPVSSVYEALTHSCYRSMDFKRRISRRENVDGSGTFKPGRVELLNGTLKVREMEKRFRLPLYDVQALTNSIGEGKKKDEAWEKICESAPENDPHAQGEELEKRFNDVIACNNLIARVAKENFEFLEKREDREDILRGNIPVWIVKSSSHQGINNFVHDEIATIVGVPNENPSKKASKAYIKFTGPNTLGVEKRNTDRDQANPPETAPAQTLWDIVLNCRHNALTHRANMKLVFSRPHHKVVLADYTYEVLKRCESVFVEGQKKTYTLPDKVKKDYELILKENKMNYETREIPEQYRSWHAGLTLKDGDLIYFEMENSIVTRMKPVLISRSVDEHSLGQRLRDDTHEPCALHCLENCKDCPERCRRTQPYFLHHPRGLCPACHLFGTPYYKGRVGFGTAWPTGSNAALLRKDELTLPRQESPKPTWSMPKSDSPVPGRKFYLHHPGNAERLQSDIPDPNNRTVQVLEKGSRFAFEVVFNRLRHWELGLLIYALELEDVLAHKIGGAKALGFGSVQIKVEQLGLDGVKGAEQNLKSNVLVEQGLDLLKGRLPYPVYQSEDYLDLFRGMLWLPSDKSAPDVCYPVLEAESFTDAKGNKRSLPGYTTILDLEKDKKKGENFLTDRLTGLKTPWFNWREMTGL
jgi:CRISPR-associated protein (TIGR03986 family)